MSHSCAMLDVQWLRSKDRHAVFYLAVSNLRSPTRHLVGRLSFCLKAESKPMKKLLSITVCLVMLALFAPAQAQNAARQRLLQQPQMMQLAAQQQTTVRSHARRSTHARHNYAGGYVSPNSRYVHGYIKKKNGRYINGYHRTAPNGTKSDNYSAKGDENPYTGKVGTVDPNK